ncbi:MAG: hypothetical protein GY822_09120 [Deltaproteobacteria bacterium]|nr:hypothetical protein [Deltaproteobacteria bacterium]
MNRPLPFSAPLLATALTTLLQGALGLGLVLSTFSPLASATVVVLHPLDEMSHRSAVIMHVKVLSSVTSEEKGRIITLTQVEVLDGIKGTEQGRIETIYQVGGTFNGRSMHISGAQSYNDGEEMVLFAMRHGARLVAYGVGVGKFTIDRDAQIIKEDLGDIVVMTLTDNGMEPNENVQPRISNSVVEFKASLRDLLAQPAPPQIVAKNKKLRKADVTKRFKKPLRTMRKMKALQKHPSLAAEGDAQ